MVAYLRQFLVVLLVLLQTAAPLVHAHVGGDDDGCGIHFHGIERLQNDADQSELHSVQHELQQQAGVVQIGSAIRLQTERERFTPAPFLFPASVEPTFQPRVGKFYCRSRSSQPPAVPIPADNASRAPPFC